MSTNVCADCCESGACTVTKPTKFQINNAWRQSTNKDVNYSSTMAFSISVAEQDCYWQYDSSTGLIIYESGSTTVKSDGNFQLECVSSEGSCGSNAHYGDVFKMKFQTTTPGGSYYNLNDPTPCGIGSFLTPEKKCSDINGSSNPDADMGSSIKFLVLPACDNDASIGDTINIGDYIYLWSKDQTQYIGTPPGSISPCEGTTFPVFISADESATCTDGGTMATWNSSDSCWDCSATVTPTISDTLIIFGVLALIGFLIFFFL